MKPNGFIPWNVHFNRDGRLIMAMNLSSNGWLASLRNHDGSSNENVKYNNAKCNLLIPLWILQISMFWQVLTWEPLKIITVNKTTFLVLRRPQIVQFQVVSRTSTHWTIVLNFSAFVFWKRFRLRFEISMLSS